MKYGLPIISAFCMLFGACEGGFNYSPTSPTRIVDGNAGNPQNEPNIAVNWSPYLVVQGDGSALNGYQEAFALLTSKNKLLGVRIGIYVNGISRPFVTLADSYRLNILGLVDLSSDLNPEINPNIENALDAIYALHPEVDYFQIGNEVTVGGNVNARPMSIEKYMAVFERIWNHTRNKHPGKILVTQSSHSGYGGAANLEQMVNLGLLRLNGANPQNLIISMNIYDSEVAYAYGDVIKSKLNGYRIWITESGINNWPDHISFVQNQYPIIRGATRAERIYWYVLWAGDSGGDAGFSLIKNPQILPFTASPLYDLISGK